MFTLPTPSEFAFAMMLVGYAITLMFAISKMADAILFLYERVAYPLCSRAFHKFAPKWLKLFDLKFEAWLTIPAWVAWKLDDMAVSALERTASRYRSVNNRKRDLLLEEAEEYDVAYAKVMQQK